jgi:hypothetical protein
MPRVKVVARFADGRVLKGHTADFSPEGSRFHLMPAHHRVPRPVEVCLKDLKAVFFVRDFGGNPGYEERKAFAADERRPGRVVTVQFHDGEVLVGSTLSYDPARAGFFLFPVDPESNNLRVFAVTAAVREVGDSTRAPAPARDAEPLPAGPAAIARGGASMSDEPDCANGDVQTAIQTVRQTIGAWEQLLRTVETLTAEQKALRERCEALEREVMKGQAVREQLVRERVEAQAALGELRHAHEILRREHEATSRALSDLRGAYEEAVRHRQSAARELETILRRLQTAAVAA